MRRYRQDQALGDEIQVVLDDDTALRLRDAALDRSMEVEQLIVLLLHRASWDVDRLLGPGETL